ncbi:serine hydrolase [Ottowia pentelensis]
MMRKWVATGGWATGLRGWTGAVLLALLALLPFSPAQAAGKKHTQAATSHRAPAKAAKAHPAKSHPAKASTAQRKTEPKASRRGARVSAKLGGRPTAAERRHGKARVASKANRLSLREKTARATREEPPARLSFGQMAGLHEVTGPLGLKSSVALVVDQDTHQVLLGKNEHAVLPIASLTKLMTGMVVSEAHLPMDQVITITDEDVDTEKNSRSRLTVGTELSRGELLHLALMSSENRAAHALGRTFPGGLNYFVSLMNARAQQLGMKDTRYVEPTGLSSANQSSAQDLAVLVNAAYQNPQLRELTTSPSHEVAVGHRLLQFNNTNGLVKSPEWDIGLQKTGFINEAGRCLVMQTRIAGRKLIMVFLDSAGKYSRIADAERVRRWVEMLPHPSTVAGHGFAG